MQIGNMSVILVALVLATAVHVGAQPIKIEKVPYFNQPNCYQLSNGSVEVIATSDIGPRIIAYRSVGGDNILGQMPATAVVKTPNGDWHPWGGHRLWHAPEDKVRTYIPDDSPLKVEMVGNDSVRLTQPVEAATGIEKQMLIKLDSDSNRVTITHTLTNRGLWPVELAPWGLTIMNGGGTTIFPNEPFISHDDRLLPARPMVLWHYTDMSDPRWRFGKKYVTLHTDSDLKFPQKVGVANKQGWAAYLRKSTLFVKRFPYQDGETYPDLGCNFETYTDGDFMEIETLGPMAKLEPGERAVHVEDWFLFNDVKADGTEGSIDKVIMPLVERTVPK
jgi:hypothetical protein